jgi:hypothetical protein
MQPERVEGKPYNIKADVWSLGWYSLQQINHFALTFVRVIID